MQSKELYIGNLDLNAKPEELREIFQLYGKINRCEVKVGDTKHTASYGFVGFESTAEAEFAKQQINGLNHRGRRLIVQFTKTKPGRNRRQERFIGLDHSENRHSHERNRSRSRSHHRRRSSSYNRRSSRDDRRRKRARSRSSSPYKSNSKRRRLSSDDDQHRSSHSHQNGNSKRR